MDVFSQDKRSDIMRRIRSAATKPEEMLRKELFQRGLRYRKNRRDLPGKPDIVFSSAKLAVFVHGCFWHQHAGCRRASIPKSNQEYWGPKLARNISRDEEVLKELAGAGWQVVVVWECEIKAGLLPVADRIEQLLIARRPTIRGRRKT